jgi:hypothetical protein
MNAKSLLAALGALFVTGSAMAQAPGAQQIRIKVKDLKFEQQQTPQISATNIVDKRWRPKTWIEVDVGMDVDIARDLGGREGSFPGIEVKYYVGVTKTTKEGKTIVLTGQISYVNVPNGESHALAFVSPSTLKRVLQKDNGNKADIGAVGIEVSAGGQVVAFQSSTGTPWWMDPATKQPLDKFAYEDGAVLGKSETPFAPFWGDYDLVSKAK